MKNLLIEDFTIYKSNNVTAYLKDIDFLQKLNKKSKALNCGRGYVLDIDGYIVRFYFHGGFLRNFLSDIFISKKRFINELAIHNYVYKNNLSVPEPIGIIFFRKFFWYHGVFITRKIENSVDLIDFLIKNKWCDFYKIGEFVKQLHNLHVIHGDLHLKNFLIDENDVIYLIDFDKSFFSEKEEDKLKNIQRFIRSFYKFQYYNFELDEKMIDDFLEGYGCDKKVQDLIKINSLKKVSWKLNKPTYKK